MNGGNNKNIESILPLSEMQEAMLLHHLFNEEDEAFLHVVFRIEGKLDIALYKQAWESVINRHEIMRSSVHWEGLEKPLIVIQKQQQIDWNYLDWTELDDAAIKKRLADLKEGHKTGGINLNKSPLLHFYLIAQGKEDYLFVWPCHHLLVDGWSTSNIIRDMLAYYEAFKAQDEVTLKAIPGLRKYIGWLKTLQLDEAGAFWKEYMGQNTDCGLLPSRQRDPNNKNVSTEYSILDSEKTNDIATYAKAGKLSLNTIIQGVWAIILAKMMNKSEVIFGTSVSGRSNSFPEMDQLAGMFMNIQPVKVSIDAEKPIQQWLSSIQENQLEALQFEHLSTNEIANFIQASSEGAVFDSLLVFENYPWKELTAPGIRITEYRSGITSTYPLTAVVIPDEELELISVSKDSCVLPSEREWIQNSWKLLMGNIHEFRQESLQKLLDLVPDFVSEPLEGLSDSRGAVPSESVAPKNEMEIKMANIWGNVLGKRDIGINDNFFDLGGTSMMAIRLFYNIEKELGIKIPPTELLKRPTIKGILSDKTSEEAPSWKYLVPLRPGGTKTPVFCIHGGEGHILFYKGLPDQLHKDRPVFTVQPKGVNGDEPMHQSIEDMSQDYLAEIRAVQNKGPYYLMYFCYSALVVEMARQLRDAGEDVELIVVDSTARSVEYRPKLSIRQRIWYYSKRVLTNPWIAIKSSISYRYRRFIEPLFNKLGRKEHLEILAQVREQLHANHEAYHWDTFDADCHLILVENDHPKLKEEKVALWKHWCTGEVTVYSNTGNHNTLFESPNIEPLGITVEHIFSSSEDG